MQIVLKRVQCMGIEGHVSDTSTNQSVEKAALVLSAFTSGLPMRVADVARAAALGQSTTSRLLATLETTGFVERDGLGLYHLGPTLITLAGAAVNAHPVHRVARQPAQQLAASLGLGANVAVRRREVLFYLCNFEGRMAPRAFTLMGQTNPLHATGLGKALLSRLSPHERRELLPDLPRYTEHTITNHDELDAAIAEIAVRGVTDEVEELALGRGCVAAPILGRDGSVVAAISVSGPLSALDLAHRRKELADALIETADAISSALGYHSPSAATRQVVGA
jgi:DNA-binding IclR family transcriptional regulator